MADTGLLSTMGIIPEEVRYRSSFALSTISLGTKPTNFKDKHEKEKTFIQTKRHEMA